MDRHAKQREPVNWTAVWAAVAAIAAILAVVVAILPYLKGDEYKIDASGDYAPFSVPEFFNDKFKSYLASIDSETLRGKMESEHSSVNIDLAPQSHNLARYFEGILNSNDIAELQGIRFLWTFSVGNRGSKEVTDLRLELPFEGYYTLYRLGEKPFFSGFKRVITIGSIRPSNNISVLVWSTDDPSTTLQDSSRITHPNGVVNIRYPVRVSGAIGWIYNSILIQAVLCGILFLLIASVVLSRVRITTPAFFAKRNGSGGEFHSNESQPRIDSRDEHELNG
jgi:hypothetical protein